MATVKKENPDGKKISITMQELVLQTVDRSRADLRKWWTSLQHAEQVSLPNRSRLLDLYERAVIDGHLSGVMEKRVTAMLNKNLHYEVKGKRVDEMDEYIRSEKFRLLRRRLWEKKAYGLTGIEFLVGAELDFVLIPRKHIKPDLGIIAYEQNGQEGIEYKSMWNILVIEDVEKFGLLNKCVPLTILKSGSLSDLAQYIEIYGQPIRKGTYPGDDPDAKSQLKQALKEAGASYSIVLPEGTTVEIIGDHVTNGNGDAHQVLFTNVNNELSIIWLGNTETTSNEKGGSNAKSQEHSKQQDEIIKNDLADMEDILGCRQMKTILQSYGWPCSPDDGGRFVHEREVDLEDLGKKKEIWISISSKVPIAPDDWYNEFGIPKPENFEALWNKMEEERQAKLNPPVPAAPPAPSQKKPAKPLNELTWIERQLINLRTVFHYGHKG